MKKITINNPAQKGIFIGLCIAIIFFDWIKNVHTWLWNQERRRAEHHLGGLYQRYIKTWKVYYAPEIDISFCLLLELGRDLDAGVKLPVKLGFVAFDSQSQGREHYFQACTIQTTSLLLPANCIIQICMHCLPLAIRPHIQSWSREVQFLVIQGIYYKIISAH